MTPRRVLIAAPLAAAGAVLLTLALTGVDTGRDGADAVALGFTCLIAAFLLTVGRQPPVGHETGRARSV